MSLIRFKENNKNRVVGFIELNKIYNEDCLNGLMKFDDNSIDMCVTSPPYYNLRDYGVNGQLGVEDTPEQYLDKLLAIYKQVYRVLKVTGTCWVNIGDVYGKNKSLLCIPDKFKLRMIEMGWICRNEIIWHKPNAMPSSVKDRFNNDYEKLFFFTKSDTYYFETQYEEAKSKPKISKNKSRNNNSKYKNEEQEKSVRQGMSKDRGGNLVEKRNLPEQQYFVDMLRKNFTVDELVEKTQLKRTTIEHWFRRDVKGFAYPKKEDWEKVETNLFPELLNVWYETDDINKNIDKGRIKRAVWSINTKPFKGGHFAPYPEELVETPVKSGCPIDGIVLDIFMGSGTTAISCIKNKRNYIGFEINNEYCDIINKRIEDCLKKRNHDS